MEFTINAALNHKLLIQRGSFLSNSVVEAGGNDLNLGHRVIDLTLALPGDLGVNLILRHRTLWAS